MTTSKVTGDFGKGLKGAKDKWEESGARGGEVCGGQVRFEKVGAIIA